MLAIFNKLCYNKISLSHVLFYIGVIDMANFETEILLSLQELEFNTKEELTPQMIKERHKTLSRMYHPDINHDDIFREKQTKINGAKDFLMQYLDEVNRYIRRVNYRETDEDRAARAAAEERARRAREEAEAKAKAEAEARAKAEAKAKAEAEERAREEARAKAEAKARAEAEAKARAKAEAKAKREAEAKAKQEAWDNATPEERAEMEARRERAKRAAATRKANAEAAKREAEERARRAAEEQRRRREEEEERRRVAQREAARRAEAARRKEKTLNIIKYGAIVLVILLVAIPVIVGACRAAIKGFNEGMENDRLSSEAADKESRTYSIIDSNIPQSFAKGIPIDWSQYYVTYKDANGKEIKVNIKSSMITADINTVGKQQIEICVGSGDDRVYLFRDVSIIDCVMIDTATELKAIASNPTGTYALSADIDLSGEDWKPIESLEGTLLGQGHTISNLTIKNISSANVGLFGRLGDNSRVENLSLTGVTIESLQTAECAGALAGIGNGKVENVSVSGRIILKSVSSVGGLVGYLDHIDESFIGCSFDGTIEGNQGVGGIVGGKEDTGRGRFENCKVSGSISGNAHVGGIAGMLRASRARTFELIGCENQATVTSLIDYCGGIVGSVRSIDSGGTPYVAIRSCTNKGTVTGKNYTAGIAGYTFVSDSMNEQLIFEGNKNTADITGNNYTSGLLGYTNHDLTMTACEHNGAVKGENYVGGFIGHGKYVVVKAAKNTTSVSGNCFVGGIAGSAYNCTDCKNSGNISAKGVDEERQLTALGGIGGALDIAENCENTGNISSVTGSGVGGICGVSNSGYYDASFKNCKNTGSVTVTGVASGVGGIVGNITRVSHDLNLTVSGCESNCSITVTAGNYVGGIVGYYQGRKTVTVTGCTADNQIKAEKVSYVGGLLGEGKKTTVIHTVTVKGAISGSKYVGWLAGYCEGIEGLDNYKPTISVPDSNYPYIGE